MTPTQDGRYVALLGAVHASAEAHAKYACVVVDLDRKHREAVCELAAVDDGSLRWEARAARTLYQAGLSLPNIAALLGCASVAEAHRRIRLGGRPADTWRHSKQLHAGHLRYLSKLDDTEFAEWVKRIERERMTVAALRAAMSGSLIETTREPQASADILAYASSIGAVLGTEVKVSWPQDAAERRIRIAWFEVSDLQGVFERLAQGGSAKGSPHAPERRWLEIAVRDADELDELVGHLVTVQ